uniref:Starch-binding domain-containing protein 1 n=1 Tax=Astyanax mexicanus TaxID=7994 RepID=A0A8B9RKC1_ASTMX
MHAECVCERESALLSPPLCVCVCACVCQCVCVCEVMVCVVSSAAAAAMLGQKSRSSAPDPPALPGWLGGSGAAVVAVCVFVAAVCACAAFLLYRAARGRSEGNTKGTAEEREQRAPESTEISDDGGSEECETDSSEAVIPSSENYTEISSDFPEEDLREPRHEKLNDSTEDDLSVSLTSDVTETSVLTPCSEHLEHYSGHIKRDAAQSVKVEADLYDYRYNRSKAVEDECEDSLKESTCNTEEFEAELPGDLDEPSETESAQETMEAKNVPVHKCQSVEDLQDNTLLAQDVVSKPIKMEPIVDEPATWHISSDDKRPLDANHETTKPDEEEAARKGCENSTGHPFLKIKDFDCCSYDEQSDLLGYNLASERAKSIEVQMKHLQDCDGRINSLGATLSHTVNSSRFDPVFNHPQLNYLGFTVPSLPCDLTGQVQLADINKERSTVSLGSGMKATCDKNEINIMEAIMDSNEWLSSGPPDTKDLPWLTQTQSNNSDIFKTNTSLVTPAVPETTTDTFRLKPGSSNPSYGLIDEEGQPQQENMAGITVAPEDTVNGVTEEGEEEDFQNKKIAAVSPMPQMVQVRFRVHYITHSPSQLLAVTGNQQELGNWESFVTLQRAEDWFWANTVTLPTENQVEWKFVLVEDGKIRRWEECENRHLLVTGQEEEIHLDKSWGFL